MGGVVVAHDEAWKGTRDRAGLYQDPTTPERRRKLALALAGLPAGSRVLDYGCGRGEFTEYLGSLGYRAVGADISEQAIEFNRRDYPNLEFVRVDPEAASPLPDGSIDAIWSSEVIEHVYDVHGIFADYARLLRPGGRLIVTTPFHGRLKSVLLVLFAFERHFNVEWQHIRFWTRNSLRKVAQAHGLRPVRWDTIGRLPWLAKSYFVVFEKASAG